MILLIFNHIFESVFLKNVGQIKKIRILTGYTSGKFLKFFVDEFPNIPIEVYIGMSQLGIKKSDHEVYQMLSQASNFYLYYQIVGNNTHIKLFEIEYYDHIETYVGSANFSASGMFEQNEVMTFVDSNNDSLFLKQFNQSVAVSDQRATELLLDDNETYIGTDDLSITEKKLDQYRRMCNPYTVSFRRNSIFLNKFKVPLVTETLNCKIHNKDGKTIIRFPSSFRARTKFPIDKNISLFYENMELQCAIDGKFNSELQFENQNLAEILLSKLRCSFDLLEEELIAYGASDILFERINETEYIISFKIRIR